MDDAYLIRLEIRQEHKPGSKITNHYKVKEVLDFKKGIVTTQEDMFDDKSQGSTEEWEDR